MLSKSESATALSKVADALGIEHTERHIFLCAEPTHAKCCSQETGLEAWDFLKRRLNELGLSSSGRIQRTRANCLRLCMEGPIAVVYLSLIHI